MPITRLLPCRHTFHDECIHGWLRSPDALIQNRGQDKCPTCKQDVTDKEHNVTLPRPPTPPPAPAPADIEAPATESAPADTEAPESGSFIAGGGADSLLDAIAASLKNADTKVLTKLIEKFKYYSEFLDLTHNDYEDIVELFININNDSNLEKLIIIITRGLGFSCTINNEPVELTANKSDNKLAKILDINRVSRINATLQTCTSVNGLNLSENQFKAVEKIKKLLTKTLSSNFNKPNKKQLLDSLELSRTTLNRILKRNN
jgi:hypothetical protein